MKKKWILKILMNIKLKINKLSFDCKEIKEKYFKNKWAIKFYKKNKDKEGIIEEAQFIDKIMNLY